MLFQNKVHKFYALSPSKRVCVCVKISDVQAVMADVYVYGYM